MFKEKIYIREFDESYSRALALQRGETVIPSALVWVAIAVVGSGFGLMLIGMVRP